jgi:CheY-like chemotaxis protein
MEHSSSVEGKLAHAALDKGQSPMSISPVALHGQRARVLVVEPDEATRTLYRKALEFAGLDVVEAADGRDALVKTLAVPPALVITEIRLPLMDGYSLCEILRRDPATRGVPILVVTSEAQLESAARARRVGADAVLVKPADITALLADTRRLLDGGTDDRRSLGGTPDAPATGEKRRGRRSASRTHPRFDTTSPPIKPPDLGCPCCSGPLSYQHSHVGGVSSRCPEQWDYYMCSACSAPFVYRPRTRKVRPAEGSNTSSQQR